MIDFFCKKIICSLLVRPLLVPSTVMEIIACLSQIQTKPREDLEIQIALRGKPQIGISKNITEVHSHLKFIILLFTRAGFLSQ